MCQVPEMDFIDGTYGVIINFPNDKTIAEVYFGHRDPRNDYRSDNFWYFNPCDMRKVGENNRIRQLMLA